jgi:hypothetical protein
MTPNAPEPSNAEQAKAATTQFAEYARKGVENFVATQKALLDLASHQNAILMDAVQGQLSKSPANTAEWLTQLTEQGVTGFVQAQKILLDLAAQQNALALTGLRASMGPSVTPLADLMKQGSDTFIETQKRLLDLAAQQSEITLRAAREGRAAMPQGTPGMDLGDLARRGVEAFVATQKQLLDLVTRRDTPNSAATSQGMEQFVAAQKAMLDMASQQMTAHMNMVGQMLRGGVNFLNPQAMPLTWADLARQGMEQYMNAQKTLLDMAFRPRSS